MKQEKIDDFRETQGNNGKSNLVVAEDNSIKTKITLRISLEDSKRVKIYAIKHQTTVSDLLHDWIGQLPEE